MHFRYEYFIWRDGCDNAGWVASLLGTLGELPGIVIGFNVSIPLPCSISCSIDR